MSDLDTAAQALQQALADNPVDGDAEASDQEGHEQPVPLAPKVQKADAAKKEITNDDAKNLRKSDAEWQQMKEATTEAKTLKEKLIAALMDAPDEVKQEPDIATQVKALQEIVRRKEWEEQHPVVKSDKYADQWKQVNEDPETASLSYDKKWKLIQDPHDFARGSKVKEELRTQQSDYVTIPLASKGSIQRGNEASSLAQEYLRKAGFTDDDIANSGVKL